MCDGGLLGPFGPIWTTRIGGFHNYYVTTLSIRLHYFLGGGGIICLLSADILQPYLQQGDGPIVLVVAPTRELAVQVL